MLKHRYNTTATVLHIYMYGSTLFMFLHNNLFIAALQKNMNTKVSVIISVLFLLFAPIVYYEEEIQKYMISIQKLLGAERLSSNKRIGFTLKKCILNVIVNSFGKSFENLKTDFDTGNPKTKKTLVLSVV